MTITSSSTSAFFGVLLISTFVLDITKEATAQRIRSKKGPSLVPFSSSSSSSSSSSPYTRERKPNIVLILTDDQDVELGSMNFMPKTLRSMRDQGAQFRHAYVTTPMCCPSRSSLLTGMYVHNHNVYTNNDNCSSTTWQATHETRSFATYLSNAGYRTGYFGKYLNKYNGSYIPPGWREWGGLIMNSKYYNYSINMNGKKIKHGDDYHKDYYPDLIANDSIAFLRQSKKNNAHKPVMLTMSFPAPHGPEDSAPQYSHLFFNVTTHHTPSYDYAPNPDKQWILQITQKMRPIHKQFTDLLMTKRLQTLQSVDSAVQRVIDELDELGELDNTYVVYTSDHGYHLGQFGLIKGKSFPFEFDIRVPFLLRGPGIEAGTVVDDVVLNIDLAPTFLDMAGVEAPSHMDGHSILPLFNAKRKKIKWPDTFLIESSGRRETPFFDMRNKRMMTSVVNYSTSAPLFVSALDEFTTKGIKTTTPQSALRVFDSSENFNDDDDDLDDIDDLEGDDAETDIDEDNDSRTEGKDLLLPFESQFFEIGQSKSEKIAEECRQDGYQLPCKFAQKWYCQIEDGRWRKHKCKQNHYPLSQSGTSRSFKKCACFTTEGLIYKKIPVNVRKSRRSNRYKRDADLQEILFQKLGNRHLTLRQKRDTLTHVESVMERVQDKLLDLEAENSSLPARVHYSTRSNLATNRIPETPECFVSANGRVTCPKAIYEDKKTWRRSRHHIDNEIQHLKQKLEKLKEIRRHLKHSKPGPSDDVLASGDGVENRTDWSSFGDYGSTEQVTERGFVEVNGSGDGNRRRNNKNDGKRKKLDDEEFWNVSTEAPGGHHRHHHTQHRDYTTSTKGFLDVAVSTEAPRGGKRKKLPADVTVKTPKPKLEVTTERSVDTNLSNGEYCECEMEEPSAVPDPREAAREAKRRLKEERLRKKLRKQRKKAQLEKECSSESAIDSRMNCFHHDNDHWRTAPLWTAGPFCFCMNANNNTYSCVRTINSTHNFLYCEFVTGLVTFYNLRIDPFELQNRIAQLKPEERSYLHDQLATLMACKGRSCSITHNTHTGGQRTRGVAHKVHSYVPQPQRYKRKRLMAEDPGNVARSLALLQPEVRPPPQHGQNSNLPSSLKQWKRRRSWGYPPNNREKQKKKQQFLNFDQYRGRWM